MDEQKTKIEVLVATCDHLKLDIDRSNCPRVPVQLVRKESRGINVGQIHGIEEYETKCAITGKSCVLYNSGGSIPTSIIEYWKIGRCPVSAHVDQKYVLEGWWSGVEDSRFTAISVKRAQ